jgi:hypothetical protein
METLKDILAYFCLNYPYPNELSKARLVKMLYLADWKNSIEYQNQLTNTNWIFNQYGPYVNDIIETIKYDNRFEIIDKTNSYGSPKQLIKVSNNYKILNLNEENKRILDFVINATSVLNYSDFIDLVYSTYPIKVSSKMSELNLIQLANDYKKSKEKIYS